jgi:hypothetical protein
MLIRALLLLVLTAGAAAQRPTAHLAVPGAAGATTSSLPHLLSNSDREKSLHDHLTRHAQVEVPPRVLNANASSGPTQVSVGLAVVSLHHVDVLSGIVDMAVWQRL